MTAGAWTTFTLDTPFAYNGTDNLVIGVLDLTGTWSGGMSCRVFSTATNQALYKYQDSGAFGIDGTYNGSAVTGTLLTVKNQIILGGIQQAFPTPTDLTATPHPTSADLSWTENGTATAWQVAYKTTAAEDFTTVTANSNPFTLTGLTGETPYTAKVRAYYSETSQSGWSAVVNFTTQVACPTPTALTSSNITTTTATLSWTIGYEETNWVLQYGTNSGFTDGTYTEVEVSGTPTKDLGSLTEATTYYARVKASCGGDEESAWSSVYSFTTVEDCPDGMVCIGTGIETSNYVPANNYYNYSLTQQIYTAEEIGEAGAILSIDFYKASTNEMVKDLDIYIVSTTKDEFTSNTDWIPVTASDLVFSGTVTFADNDWTTIELDNPFVYDGTSNICIVVDNNTGDYVSSTNFRVFTAEKNQTIYQYSDGTNLDPTTSLTTTGFTKTSKNRIRLGMGEPPACAKPTGLAVNYEGGATATVTWNGEAGSYNIDVNGTVTNGVTSPYTLNGLELGTTYQVKVQAVCSESAQSEWTSPVSFTTDLCLPEDMCAINITLTDAYGDGWNGGKLEVVDALTYQVLGTYTLTSGGEGAFTLSVCDGREINFVYTSGSYAYENGYIITDINEEIIAEHEGCSSNGDCTAPTNGIIATYTVNCTVNTCRKPTDLAASEIGPHSVVLGWTENGEATAWKICVNGDTENLIDADTNPYTLTGLAAETQYTVKVAPVCEVEKWSDEITLTTEIACPAPTDVAAGNITSTSAEISWKGNADATSYNLRYRTPRGFNYGFETADPWTITDFSPCSIYDGDQAQGYSFQGSSFTNIPFTGSTIAFQSQEGNLSSHSGNAFGLMISAVPDNYPEGITHSDDWFILPEITISEGDVFSFWGREITDQYGDETINVGIYGDTDGTFAVTIAENVAVNSTTWTEYSYDLSAYAGQTIKLAINYVSNDVFGFMFDDIFVGNPYDDTWDETLTNVTSPKELTGLTPSTTYEVEVQAVYADGTSAWVGNSFITNVAYPAPTDLTVEDLGTTTATINWTAAEGPTGYAYQYKKASATEWSTEATITGTSVDLSGLDDATAYNFRVKAVYAGGVSSYATIDFITDCLPKDLPYSYDFQDLVELNCWSLLNTDNANSIGITSNDGNYALYFSSYNSASSYDQYLISPTLNATSPVAVEFSYMNTNSSDETFKVGYSTTTPELTEFTWSDEIISSDNENWTQYKNIFPAGTKYVAIYYYSNYQYYLMIDDFSFTVPESTNITFAKEGYATYYNGEKDVVLPAGMKAHVVTDGSTSLTYAKIADGDMDENVVPAETAVLLQVEPSTEDQTLPVYLVTPSAAAYAGTNLLFGSDVDATTTGGEKFYKLTYSNNNDKFGWYWGATDGGAFSSPAHKAWLALPASGAPSFLGLPDWDTTGIVPVSVNPEDGEWYTLQGMKVGKKPTTAGVYIHNGKKFVIK